MTLMIKSYQRLLTILMIMGLFMGYLLTKDVSVYYGLLGVGVYCGTLYLILFFGYHRVSRNRDTMIKSLNKWLAKTKKEDIIRKVNREFLNYQGEVMKKKEDGWNYELSYNHKGFTFYAYPTKKFPVKTELKIVFDSFLVNTEFHSWILELDVDDVHSFIMECVALTDAGDIDFLLK